MKDKRIMLGIFLVILVLPLCIGNSISNAAKLYRRYDPHYLLEMDKRINERGKFSISVPEIWEATNTPEGNHGDKDVLMIVSALGSQPLLEVASTNIADKSLEQIITWGKQRIGKYGRYVLMSESGYSIRDAYDGILLEYSQERKDFFGNQQTFRCINWYTSRESVAFSFSFCVENSKWDTLDEVFIEMLNSIVFDN